MACSNDIPSSLATSSTRFASIFRVSSLSSLWFSLTRLYLIPIESAVLNTSAASEIAIDSSYSGPIVQQVRTRRLQKGCTHRLSKVPIPFTIQIAAALFAGRRTTTLDTHTSSGFPSDWILTTLPSHSTASSSSVSRHRSSPAVNSSPRVRPSAINELRDRHNGALIFENQSTVFIRGSGGFGAKHVGKDRGAATAANAIPNRALDAILEEKTVPIQAALYRLSGDTSPLHILPEFAAIGGFDRPILHGLSSMGKAGKHVFEVFGPFKDSI